MAVTRIFRFTQRDRERERDWVKVDRGEREAEKKIFVQRDFLCLNQPRFILSFRFLATLFLSFNWKRG